MDHRNRLKIQKANLKIFKKTYPIQNTYISETVVTLRKIKA